MFNKLKVTRVGFLLLPKLLRSLQVCSVIMLFLSNMIAISEKKKNRGEITVELSTLNIYFKSMLKGLHWKILNRCNSHAFKTDQKGMGHSAIMEPRYCKNAHYIAPKSFYSKLLDERSSFFSKTPRLLLPQRISCDSW